MIKPEVEFVINFVTTVKHYSKTLRYRTYLSTYCNNKVEKTLFSNANIKHYLASGNSNKM